MLRLLLGQEQNHILLVVEASLLAVEEAVPSEEEAVAVASVNTYILNNKEYPIEIIRKNNKNTYLRVKEGKIIVTTNYLTSSLQ